MDAEILENLYDNYINAFHRVGIKILSDETCCKLLAIVYCCAVEDFVFNKKLNSDVMCAAKVAKIDGGETPRIEFVEQIQNYIKEIKHANTEYYQHGMVGNPFPEWACDFMKTRYNINLPNYII